MNRYSLELGCHCYTQQNRGSVLPAGSLRGIQMCYRLSLSSEGHMAFQSYLLLGESPDGTVRSASRGWGSALALETTHSLLPPPQSSSYIRLCLALSGGGESVFSEVSGWGLAQFVDRGQHALTFRSQPRI